MSKNVVVVGSGIIGTACAHYLVESGHRVTILEKGQFGRACSYANCGYVCPSHVLPLAMPGAIQRTMKMALQRDSAFRIKFRLNWQFWKWMFRFARRCNQRDMMESAKAINPLLQWSRTLYTELMNDLGQASDWQTRGLLFVFASQKAMEHYAETNELLTREFGVSATPYAGEQLTVLEPSLKPGSAGGWHYAGDAHMRPDRLLSAWQSSLQARGVKIVENTPLEQWQTHGSKVHLINTPQGEITADAVVIATGAWTPQLAKLLRTQIPIQPGKGYSVTMARPSICPAIPMIFEEHHVAVTPFASGYRIGSMMEFVGYDESIAPKRIQFLKNSAAHYLREPVAVPETEQWYGWRPMTPTSRPMICRLPKLENVYLAAGHNMLGLSMAPATGKLISQLVSEVATDIPTAPYQVA
ncbi:MAG: FAD-dependent oxidoreductase [Zavarzinella sp.]